MKPEEFIAAIAPAARASMGKTKIPASFVIAEGALESGWGGSRLAAEAKNLFGVKADKAWRGDVLTMRTQEFIKGQWIVETALWRKYANWQGCMDDHAAFLLTNPRYKPAFACADATSFARAIQTCGYATDPQYADKILSVMRAHNLAQFDKGLS